MKNLSLFLVLILVGCGSVTVGGSSGSVTKRSGETVASSARGGVFLFESPADDVREIARAQGQLTLAEAHSEYFTEIAGRRWYTSDDAVEKAELRRRIALLESQTKGGGNKSAPGSTAAPSSAGPVTAEQVLDTYETKIENTHSGRELGSLLERTTPTIVKGIRGSSTSHIPFIDFVKKLSNWLATLDPTEDGEHLETLKIAVDELMKTLGDKSKPEFRSGLDALNKLATEIENRRSEFSPAGRDLFDAITELQVSLSSRTRGAGARTPTNNQTPAPASPARVPNQSRPAAPSGATRQPERGVQP